MMRARRFRLLAAALALPLLIVGCADPEADVPPEDEDAQFGAVDVNRDTPDGDEPDAPEGDAPVTEDGVPIATPEFPPGIELIGCATEIDHTVNDDDYSTLWTWVFECRSAGPFERTVAAMNDSGLHRSLDESGGTETYLIAAHHYIGDPDGRTWDVDLRASGPTDNLEVTYTVMLSKD